MAQYWQGTAPTTCDHCGSPITTIFSDMKTRLGPWAILDDKCVANVAAGGYGTGLGQRYLRQQDGRWMKVQG